MYLSRFLFDLKQAYDSTLRVKLWDAMSIPQKLIRLIQMCVDGASSRLRIGNTTSELFNIEHGLKQGDALSSLLFNIALEKAVRAAKTFLEMFTAGGPKLLLAFADDIDRVGAGNHSHKRRVC